MKTLNEMTKAQLVEMVEAINAELATNADSYAAELADKDRSIELLQNAANIRLSVGHDVDNRGVVDYRFEDTQVTFTGKAEGETKTVQLEAIFAQPEVMKYLLRYAIKRATNDTCKTFAEVKDRVELWERGYPTLADYKAATRVEPAKATKATSTNKAVNIGGLTDAEIIATIESLGGEFDAIAATLMTVDKAMFAPAVKFLQDKHSEVANALRKRVEAKRQEAIAAQQAALASIFG